VTALVFFTSIALSLIVNITDFRRKKIQRSDESKI